MRKEIVALIVAGLAYSLMGFAYIHSTFPSKDLFGMVVHRLERIEIKLDKLLGNK